MNFNRLNQVILSVVILLNGGMSAWPLENDIFGEEQNRSNNQNKAIIEESLVPEVNEITWWDLLSKEEVDYYAKLNEAYSDDPYYIPETDPPLPGVNKRIDGKRILLVGYVVAVDVDQQDFSKATSFLFVPYQGACVHVPPPPTNQTIFVESDEPKHFDPYMAFWLEGTIHVEKGSNEFASFSYTVKSDTMKSYVDELFW